MKWAALESKMLSATAYDLSKQILYLRFETPARSIATLNSRPPITTPSWAPHRRAVIFALASAITSATSAWPSSRPPDFAFNSLENPPFVVETFLIPPLILNDLGAINPV